MNTRPLVHSSFLLLVAPFLYLLIKSPITPWQETVMFHFLLTNFMLSVWFWSTVLKPYGWIHRIDGLMARISILLVSLYIFLYKSFYKKIIFGFILLLLSACFRLSNHYSSQEWVSLTHIFYHRWLHFIVATGASITFL